MHASCGAGLWRVELLGVRDLGEVRVEPYIIPVASTELDGISFGISTFVRFQRVHDGWGW